MAQKVSSSPRFPLRTLVLMLLALAAFIWMYWASHHAQTSRAPANAGNVVDVTINPTTPDAGT